MNLFIETENGATKNHPAFEDNLIQAFGAVPTQWEAFTRVERPVPAVYQVLDSQEPTYQKVDDVWTDVWSLRDMTADEIAAKQQAAKEAWAALRKAVSPASPAWMARAKSYGRRQMGSGAWISWSTTPASWAGSCWWI